MIFRWLYFTVSAAFWFGMALMSAVIFITDPGHEFMAPVFLALGYFFHRAGRLLDAQVAPLISDLSE